MITALGERTASTPSRLWLVMALSCALSTALTFSSSGLSLFDSCAWILDCNAATAVTADKPVMNEVLRFMGGFFFEILRWSSCARWRRRVFLDFDIGREAHSRPAVIHVSACFTRFCLPQSSVTITAVIATDGAPT